VPHKPQRGPIDWRLLSSGEKQILILLTQALLSERSPVVYVADEPELSLHVSWQEKLLGALTKLAGRCQFIVATHSPDIAAGFGSKIIDLARF
jgi:predicted ATPase